MYDNCKNFAKKIFTEFGEAKCRGKVLRSDHWGMKGYLWGRSPGYQGIC